MSAFGIIVFFAALAWALNKNANGSDEGGDRPSPHSEEVHMADPQYDADTPLTPPPFPERKPLFLEHPLDGWSATRRRFNLTFRSRPAGDEEFYVIWGWDPDALEIHFPVPRCLLTLEITFEGSPVIPVFSLTFLQGKEELDITRSGAWNMSPAGAVLKLAVGETLPVSTVLIGLPDSARESGVIVRPRVMRRKEPDRELSLGAVRALNLGQYEEGLARLNAYEKEWSSHNPMVMYNLGRLMVVRGQPDLAQYHAVRLLAHSMMESGHEIYRMVEDQGKWRHSKAEIKDDRARVRDWNLEDHHGLVTLDAKRSFVVGLNGFHWERHSEVTEIRRNAAARLMRRILFPLEQGRSYLIHSEVRVFRREGKVEKIPQDRFSFVSAENDNPFIPVARKQEGQWMLPDLEVGDAVELNYSVLNRDRGNDPESGLFLLNSFSSCLLPIFRGRLEILNPNGLELDCAGRNHEIDPEDSQDEILGFQKTSFTGHRILPRFNSGIPFERTVLNPVVACHTRGDGWAETATRLFGSTEEAMQAHEGPPAELLKAMEGVEDTMEALARAFYWVRDRIKYGSLASGNLMVQSERRAENLVAAGIGDCKDKSFLLALVCRHLGVEYDFVLVSTDNGVIIDELPADQFNHIILRAKAPDGWLYLDASDEMGTFGNVPYGLQGLQGLIPSGGDQLIVIPEDPSHRNRILADEKVTGILDGWLMTEIDLTLHGNLARNFDEVWKNWSLHAPRPVLAAEASLRMIFPDLVVEDFRRLAGTSDSDSCRFTCRGRRGRLVAMGDQRLGSLKWEVPSLSPEWIRRLDIREQFVFPFCLEVNTRLEISGTALVDLAEVSGVGRFDAHFGNVEEKVSREPGSLIASRKITIGERTVSREFLEELPGFLAASEDALAVVAAFWQGPEKLS